MQKNTIPEDDQEDETEQSLSDSLQTTRYISTVHENMVHPSNPSLCSGIFAEKVESDGTRLEVTPLEAPWRSGKTECAGRDWKEDHHKMRQDGPEAPTWKDFEEDFDAEASKNNDSGCSAYQRVFGRNPPQMEDAAASAFLADGWSTESVSRVVRTARTRQENHEKERAEHAYYSHIHDEVTISVIFPATVQGLDGGEHPVENTIPEDDQEDETEQSLSDSLQTTRHISTVHENMVHPSNPSLCSGIFAEKVESDGTRLEVTPLEAPWRSGKTECAGRDWKEDHHKMTQDGPEAPTWKDFEEDCDAEASKHNDSAYQRVFGRNPPQMEDAVLECGRTDPGVVSRQQTGELAARLALDQKRRWKRALFHAAKHYKGKLHVGQPLWFRRPFHDET